VLGFLDRCNDEQVTLLLFVFLFFFAVSLTEKSWTLVDVVRDYIKACVDKDVQLVVSHPRMKK
jgi:hypothetical protein